MSKKLDLHAMYNLSYLIRYSNVPRIKDESVAEHSFYVALGVIKLYEDYEFDLYRAVMMAVTHDLIESSIGDISYMLKSANPMIAEEIKKIERIEQDKYPDYIRELMDEYDKQETVESIICHISDAYQCHIYASHEVKLGNEGHMDCVKTGAELRANKLMKTIEEYKR